MKKVISLTIAMIFLISFVSAIGITYPQPQNIELRPEESSYFTFQIQSDNFPLSCVPIIEETQGLELAFNQEYQVEARQRYNVKPQIIVPKQTAFGSYQASFCMECSPSEDVEGSKIIPRICNLPVTVNVVSDRTQDNMFDSTAGGNFMIWISLLILSVVLLAAIIFYLVRRRSATIQVSAGQIKTKK